MAKDLTKMSLNELRKLHLEVTGEATKDRSKKRLIAKIEAEQQSIEVVEKKKKAKPKAEDGEKRLSKMTVEELQALHLELIGRPTTSSHHRYLVWRCTQAKKGRIKTGPLSRTTRGPVKVLPLRIPEAAVEPLGEATKRLELRSRNELLLQAVHAYLGQNGEDEVAALFADDE